ncbi:hypothetical protein BCV72DRAFT_227524 [Rhizopus microsporus var. microsporus]|uniref:Uncharacterized protein n=1 Tax=Rhizopus microsporus var. microsporus TaxID=86635 RepID=A0A1X0R4M9_RHIZD|nr:hypothetical protein BCV72DRAFT_227524 [Rhizopus microsporus var. microsporus]
MSYVPLPTEDVIIENEASNEAISLTSQEDVHNPPQKNFLGGAGTEAPPIRNLPTTPSQATSSEELPVVIDTRLSGHYESPNDLTIHSSTTLHSSAR